MYVLCFVHHHLSTFYRSDIGVGMGEIADVQELMAFRDFPFPDDTPLFPDRRESLSPRP